MKKAIAILVMVLAFTVINAQEVYRFYTETSKTSSEAETELVTTFLIKDGAYITDGDHKITMVSSFSKITTESGNELFQASGVDWDDDVVYVLLDTDGDVDTFGLFWESGFWQMFTGKLVSDRKSI